MMNNQILKTIKGLKTFTIEDIELITDCSETEIIEVIENLNLQERNGIYFFEKIQQATAPIKTGVVGKNIFLKTYAQRFLETLNCGDTTKRSYEIYLKLHILPYLGSKRIIDINSSDIDNFRNKKIGESCSNKNINNFINLLSRIFEFAIDQNLIDKNPCRDIEKLKTESKKKELSDFQINNLLNIVKTEDYSFYVMLLTAVETGLSRGQILNLTWDDVNFKTEKIGGIKVSDKLMTVLNKWQKICPVYSSNLVFPNKNGNKICGDNMIKRKFKPLCKRVGLEDLRFIDLRVNSIK